MASLCARLTEILFGGGFAPPRGCHVQTPHRRGVFFLISPLLSVDCPFWTLPHRGQAHIARRPFDLACLDTTPRLQECCQDCSGGVVLFIEESPEIQRTATCTRWARVTADAGDRGGKEAVSPGSLLFDGEERALIWQTSSPSRAEPIRRCTGEILPAQAAARTGGKSAAAESVRVSSASPSRPRPRAVEQDAC